MTILYKHKIYIAYKCVVMRITLPMIELIALNRDFQILIIFKSMSILDFSDFKDINNYDYLYFAKYYSRND